MNIRKAKLNDVDEVFKLVNSTYNLPRENKISKEEILENYYVCEENNKILGLCGISKARDINYFDQKLQLQGREILYLVVDENYRHQGIGTKLLQECCCSKETPIFCEVWENSNIVNFLKNCGFLLFLDLGYTYYKNHGYCLYCVNYDTGCCSSCKVEIWVKV
jgi:N-acetylglutamate synthase-like GNAT family acetyltransferase